MRLLTFAWLAIGFVSLTVHAGAPILTCNVLVTMTGNPKFYLEYGRDAWTGDGMLICANGGSIVQRPVKVNFNSTAESFGAGRDSVVNMTFSLKTTTSPKILRIFASVKSIETPKDIFWKIDSDTTQTQVHMYVSDKDTALRKSLSRGTLYVR